MEIASRRTTPGDQSVIVENDTKPSPPQRRQPEKQALRITAIYLLVAGAWAIVSTSILRLVLQDHDLGTVLVLQGWIYVLATALLIHYLTYRSMLRLQVMSHALSRRKGQLQALLRVLPDLAFRISREGRILSYHTPEDDLLTLPAEKFLGRRISDVLPREVSEPAMKAVRKCLLTRAPVQFEYELTTLNGEPRVFEARLSPLTGETVIALCRDVTESRRVEAERARLAAAVEQALEGIAISDAHGRVIYCNPGFEKVVGIPQSRILGRNIQALRSEYPWDYSPPGIQACLSDGRPWQGRITLKKDNRTRHIRASVSPLRDEHGRVTNFVAVLRDVTHELELENRFLQMQKMECVTRLSAGIAHDFNNLLTTVTGMAEDLLSRTDISDEIRADIKHILRAATSGTRLARRLVSLSKPEAVHPQPVILDHIAQNMSSILQRTLGPDIKLRTELAAADAPVVADVGQMEQVIMNLAVNARDAMPRGGSLLIRTERIAIGPQDIRSRLGINPGDYVVLAVRDTGTGMDPEVKERAFEPFFTTKTDSGSGLGLSTVYGIVRQHQGYVELDSTPGMGTEVRVYLPCSGEGRARRPPAEDHPDRAGPHTTDARQSGLRLE
ncbi:MAG TPA: PAS domain S-box protein [Kiritimatiellae bacterium]|nr:PAS domain S-box protein [Kiritimatiellia bacterium]